MVDVASEAAGELALDGIEASVFNARFIKPIDRDAIVELAQRCRAFVTVEENTVVGGFGSAVLEVLADEGIDIPVRRLGVPDRIWEQASQARLRELAGLSPAGVVDAALQVIKARPTASATSGVLSTL
jgi:1-deoxy-D-xylulose-5-phosphate synthase